MGNFKKRAVEKRESLKNNKKEYDFKILRKTEDFENCITTLFDKGKFLRGGVKLKDLGKGERTEGRLN
ncbi:hypothetical protein CHS0354_031044 [Potamilus streckersoni]|uniref:Uncharacterized protein n=1 Tax=Potamilus streckersoni TaxID=2493646 RepID=A0AAE0WB31_9BIVA|nr:hypothetical protein CHS0354_031044 [Potamilus streckersoni]